MRSWSRAWLVAGLERRPSCADSAGTRRSRSTSEAVQAWASRRPAKIVASGTEAGRKRTHEAGFLTGTFAREAERRVGQREDGTNPRQHVFVPDLSDVMRAPWGACYAESHFVGMHWRRLSSGGEGMTWDRFCQMIADLPVDQMKTPGGKLVIVCPAQWSQATCQDCQLCAKPKRKVIIGFWAHGPGKAEICSTFQLPLFG